MSRTGDVFNNMGIDSIEPIISGIMSRAFIVSPRSREWEVDYIIEQVHELTTRFFYREIGIALVICDGLINNFSLTLR